MVGELLNEKGGAREKGRWRQNNTSQIEKNAKGLNIRGRWLEKKKKNCWRGKKRVIEGCENTLESKAFYEVPKGTNNQVRSEQGVQGEKKFFCEVDEVKCTNPTCVSLYLLKLKKKPFCNHGCFSKLVKL